MARTKGTFPFTGTLEVASTAPLDARLLVKTKADLMLEDTWKNGNSIYLYNHIVVTVEDVEGQFMLTNYDPTTTPTAYQNEANWVRLDTNIFLTQEEYDLLGTDIKKDAIYIITNDKPQDKPEDKPELKIQGPFIVRDGLLEEVDTIEDNNYYVFKVNNDYFFIYKSSSIISLPKDPSLYKQITGNFQILQDSRVVGYEYCVPEVVDVESLDDIGIESLLKDITIVDSLGSQESIPMNFYAEGFRDYSEQGTFNGIYVNTNNGNIQLKSTKILGRATNVMYNPRIIYYRFPNTLHTYHMDDHRNIISQECLNKNNYKIYDYLNDSFIGTKKLEFIKKNNTTYDKELTAVSKKTGLDLTNRLDFNNDSNIIVGKIIEFDKITLFRYTDVSDTSNENIEEVKTISPTNNICWKKIGNDFLVLVSRSGGIMQEPPSAVKLRVKNDLSVLKYDSSNNQHYFPVSVEKIEEFKDEDVSGFLYNIIVPAVDGIDVISDQTEDTNPWTDKYNLPKMDINIQSSSINTGLKIGYNNPDFINTYEYRYWGTESKFIDQEGHEYNLKYSPIIVPKNSYYINYIIDQNIEPYASEVISEGKYKRLVYNTAIGFNCPSYIIPSLYYYLHLAPTQYQRLIGVEIIPPSNNKYEPFIKGLKSKYNIDLSNRFSYDEGTISNYMLLHVKTKTMN